MSARAWLRLALFVCASGSPTLVAAQVTSGWVTGTIQYYEFNGNFCDDSGPPAAPPPQGQNCTDTTYRRSLHYQEDRAIKEAKVTIWGALNGGGFPWIVGSGSTNTSGVFLIPWNSASAPDFLFFNWSPEHVSGSFRIVQTNAASWGFNSGIWTPAAGTTSSNPQSMDFFGPNVFGSPGSANAVANVYGMAELMSASLKENALLNTAFTNVEVRAFYPNNVPGPFGVCDNACANFVGGVPTGQATVQLNQNDGFNPQARILHEMGHIASRRLNWRRLTADVCWPDTLIPASNPPTCLDSPTDADAIAQPFQWWLSSPNSGEWGNAGFEEGLATFMGDRAIYRQNAISPTSCNSLAACPASFSGGWVEFSTGNGVVSACNQGAFVNGDPQFLRRSAMITDRYLRDVYDNSNDSIACPPGDATCQRGRSFNDTQARSWAEVLDVITRFPNGFNDHQDEEPYVNAGTNNIDDLEGVRVHDFVYVYSSVGSPIVGTNSARTYNCTAY